jgi:hypothetical protein
MNCCVSVFVFAVCLLVPAGALRADEAVVRMVIKQGASNLGARRAVGLLDRYKAFLISRCLHPTATFKQCLAGAA